MCGIVGLYNFDKSPVDPTLLRQMMRIVRHRGPDDSGVRLFSLEGSKPNSVEILEGSPSGTYVGFEGGIGFNRLSILDLTATGHQPMCDPEGTIILAFNGEIYNAFDFKAGLIEEGYKFRGTSDTEVLLYLYKHYGLERALELVNGMFAFCLCDLAARKVFLVRDPLGIKPLYYYRDDKRLLFGSEVKAFFAHPAFQPALDVECLGEYFAFRYCAGNHNLLRGVRALLPGHVMELGPGHVRIRPFWKLRYTHSSGNSGPDEIDRKLEQTLRESVQRQMISDVEVGCQLSGGIDSSLVAMMASEAVGHRLHAISITLDNSQYSEERFADRYAQRYPIDCHKFRLDADFFISNLKNATWFMDQPISHPNSLGIFLLAEKSKSWMTVMLSGEGADELFGGYPRYAFASLNLRPFARAVLPFIRLAPEYVRHRFRVRFGSDPGLDNVGWFIASSTFMPPDVFEKVIPAANFMVEIERRRDFFDDSEKDFIKNCLAFDLKTYLVDLLVRQDKMTMAHSIENRVPFLDNKMLDLWSWLPSKSLVGPALFCERLTTKIPIKRISERYFGRDFAYRKKMGFGIPLREFFASPAFEELMEYELLPGMLKRGLIRGDIVRKWWKRLPLLSYSEAECLWICIAFELWALTFLDGNASRRFCVE